MIFNVPLEYDVIETLVRFMRSLFILYVHEHDRLDFWMLTVETAAFDCIY